MSKTTRSFPVIGLRLTRQAIFVGVLALVLVPASGFAQPGPRAQADAPALAQAAPKPITLDDYPKFRRITGASLSNDGKWILYTITPNEGDATLYVKSLDTDTVHEITRGTNASFSDTGGWVGYFIAPPSGNGRGGRGGRGGGRGGAAQPGEGSPAPARAFELLDLATGTSMPFAGVGSFSFSPDGEWLLMRPGGGGAPAAGGGRGGRGGGAATPEDMSTPGADLVMRHLATGNQRYIGNVGSYAFDDSGALLAYTVRGQERLGNGVYVMTLTSGSAEMLDSAAADYDQLSWSEEGTHLAVLRGEKAREKAQKDNVVLAWTNVGTPETRKMTFEPAAMTGLPDGMVVSEFASIRWNNEGTRLLLGVKEQEPAAPESNEPAANVDVWHWKDKVAQSVQIVRLNQDRRATYAAVLDLASDARPAGRRRGDVRPDADRQWHWAIGRDDTAYATDGSWGGSRADNYRVNVTSGERTLIDEV